jgi:HlyD family secretion protein
MTRISRMAAIALAFCLSGVSLSDPPHHLLSAAQAEGLFKTLIAKLRGSQLPDGIVKSNGRIEATQVDVSSKYAGRLEDVTVQEGSTVQQGQIIARISSPESEARLRAAQSEVQRAKQALNAAIADIAAQQSALDFAKSDFERGQELIKSGNITHQLLEQRQRNFHAAEASVQAAIAKRDQAQAAIVSSEAEVDRTQAIVHDLTLTSPRSGRVQYQLARAGEVVSVGSPIVTVLDLTDVYLTIFLPAADAGRLAIGDAARIILDPAPDYVVPATVSFVAADAQFTPKTVETADERAKLMFRIKLQVPPNILKKYYSQVKTGVRGVGFVRTKLDVEWPADLQIKLPATPAPIDTHGDADADSTNAPAPDASTSDAKPATNVR